MLCGNMVDVDIKMLALNTWNGFNLEHIEITQKR